MLDLPAELLIHTLHYLVEDQLLWDRVKLLLPLALVSRRWYEFTRPMLFHSIRFTPSRSKQLLNVLNSTRKWSRQVKCMRISFGLHYNPACTPIILSLIASCTNLRRLEIVGCGKPVHKSFLAQSSSVLYASDLYNVLSNLTHLHITGGRKKGSTGLDAAKLTSFLLPKCRHLTHLERGELSYLTTKCATLQPMVDLSMPDAVSMSNPSPGSASIPSLANLTTLTLASATLSARAFTQAFAIVHPAVIEQVIIRSNDIPTRRYLQDIVFNLGPNLRSLKLDIMFPSHRLYQVIDEAPLFMPNLEVLVLCGPLCTDVMLVHLTARLSDNSRSKLSKLRQLTLAHNRSITPAGLSYFLMHFKPSSETESQPRTLILDDLLAPDWTAHVHKHFASAAELRETGWDIRISAYEWRDFEGDDAVYGGQRRPLMPTDDLLGWLPEPPTDDQVFSDPSPDLIRGYAMFHEYDPDVSPPWSPVASASETGDVGSEEHDSDDDETDSSAYESDWEIERDNGIPCLQQILSHPLAGPDGAVGRTRKLPRPSLGWLHTSTDNNSSPDKIWRLATSQYLPPVPGPATIHPHATMFEQGLTAASMSYETHHSLPFVRLEEERTPVEAVIDRPHSTRRS